MSRPDIEGIKAWLIDEAHDAAKYGQPTDPNHKEVWALLDYVAELEAENQRVHGDRDDWFRDGFRAAQEQYDPDPNHRRPLTTMSTNPESE